MPINLQSPITYLITGGETTRATTPASEDFARILALVRAAAAAGVSLIQLREKNLTARTLCELAARASRLTRGSATRLLINDRADIARAAGADGVHLTARSLEAHVVRRCFGSDLLIGVSAHSLAEAIAARDGGADFITFGPVFDTPSKRMYGAALGLDKLTEAARYLAPFPLVALGGVTSDNTPEVLRAGAKGIAAIRLFSDPRNLNATVLAIRNQRPKL